MKVVKKTRHGRHKEDKVVFGFYVEPEFKALAQLVANKMECNVHDVVRKGVETLATKLGILKDGVIQDDYRMVIEAMSAIIRHNRNKKRNEQ